MNNETTTATATATAIATAIKAMNELVSGGMWTVTMGELFKAACTLAEIESKTQHHEIAIKVMIGIRCGDWERATRIEMKDAIDFFNALEAGSAK